MKFFRPDSLQEALEIKASHPAGVPVFGGTDVMVGLNFGRSRPAAIVDLTHVPELGEWEEKAGRLRVGAGVTYARVLTELADSLPGLALASRMVGSPQIRNRGSVGGNLGTASPAGDALPPLYVSEAEVEVVSTGGRRLIPVADFITGPGKTIIGEDELISAFHMPRAGGPQQYAKVGTRNAMVIAVCSLGLALDARRQTVRVCLGSAGPSPILARRAQTFIKGVLEEEGLWESRRGIGDTALERFGELVGMAARPIDDVRGSAAYRTHAVGVLARRTLTWAWDEYGEGS